MSAGGDRWRSDDAGPRVLRHHAYGTQLRREVCGQTLRAAAYMSSRIQARSSQHRDASRVPTDKQECPPSYRSDSQAAGGAATASTGTRLHGSKKLVMSLTNTTAAIERQLGWWVRSSGGGPLLMFPFRSRAPARAERGIDRRLRGLPVVQSGRRGHRGALLVYADWSHVDEVAALLCEEHSRPDQRDGCSVTSGPVE